MVRPPSLQLGQLEAQPGQLRQEGIAELPSAMGFAFREGARFGQGGPGRGQFMLQRGGAGFVEEVGRQRRGGFHVSQEGGQYGGHLGADLQAGGCGGEEGRDGVGLVRHGCGGRTKIVAAFGRGHGWVGAEERLQ